MWSASAASSSPSASYVCTGWMWWPCSPIVCVGLMCLFFIESVCSQPHLHQLLCEDLAKRLLFLQKPWKLAEGSDFMAASTVFILLQIRASSQGLLCIISKFNFFISTVGVVAAASFVRTIKHLAGSSL